MVPHYQPSILVWCLTIGHVFSRGASLSALPVGVVPHYGPCLLAWYLTIGLVCWSIATETDILLAEFRWKKDGVWCYLYRGAIISDIVSKGAKIRSGYNQVPHPTQDTNGKVTNSQLDTTNESQEVSPFPAGDHKAHINRRAKRHSKHKTEQKHKRSTKEVPPWNG